MHDSSTVSPQVVILCGGRGTRLGAETDVIPKPLVTVAGKPILWHIMSHYARFGLTRFVLCLGYKGEKIREYFLDYRTHQNDFTIRLDGQHDVEVHVADEPGWEVTCADTGLDTQTGARIRRVERYVKSPYFLCTYGDGVSDVDISALVDFHLESGRIATVTGVHPPARWGELVLGDNANVSEFSEKPILGPRAGKGHSYVNGGFFVFDRRVFDYLTTDDSCILERTPLERLAREEQLGIYRHDGFWQCMDVPKDRDMLDELLAPGGPYAALNGHNDERIAVEVAR